MKKLFAFFLIVFFPLQTIAGLKISSVFPQPDTGIADEFVEIINPKCESVNLQDYILQIDEKREVPLWNDILWSKERKKLSRSDFSQVQLADKKGIVVLKKTSGEIIDTFSYEKSDVKRGVVITIPVSEDNCNEKIEENNTSENADEEKDSNTENTTETTSWLSPIEWRFINSNADSFLDVFQIIFSENLTGSLDASDVTFVKFSDGNAEEFSDISVTTVAIKENSLILSLTGAITQENLWTFENDIFSGIFPKIANFSHLTSISGKKLSPINEKSFDNYGNIVVEIIKNTEQNDSDEETWSGEVDTHTNTGITDNEAYFPEILPTFQRTTTATLSKETLYCSEKPCRINLNFDTIFSDKFPKKDFTCEMLVENEKIAGCNPPQMSFSDPTEMTFVLHHIPTKQEKTAIFSLDFSQVQETETSSDRVFRRSSKVFTPSTNPIIVIDSDGKFEEIYEWKNEDEIVCFRVKCPINLNASESYSKEDALLKFFWKFGNISESNRKNPTTVLFETGTHEISLLIRDENEKEAMKKISVFVPEIDVKKIENEKEKTEKILTKNLKNEEKEFEIFEEPDVILQNPENFEFWENEDDLYCETKNKSCSVNFTLSKTQKSFSYFWDWNGENIKSTNPRAKLLLPGNHRLTVFAVSKNNENERVWEKTISVTVKQIIPPKKSRKTVVKAVKKIQKKAKSKQKSETIPKIAEEKVEQILPEEVVHIEKEENNLPMSLAGMLLSGAVFARLRKK